MADGSDGKPQDLRLLANNKVAELLGDSVAEVTTRQYAPVVRMHKYAMTDPTKISFELKFKDPDISPEDAIAKIQESLSKAKIIKDEYNGLKTIEPTKEVKTEAESESTTILTKFNKIVAENPAQDKSTKGFLEEEIKMLQESAALKERYSDNYTSFDSSMPASIAFNFENVAAADEAKHALTARAEDIKAAIIKSVTENASKHLTAEEIKELQNLRIDVNEYQYGSNNASLNIAIGVPNNEAPVGPDGKHPLKISSLNKLFEIHPVEGEKSLGDKIMRHAVIYAGDDWVKTFSALAHKDTIKTFLENRLNSTDPEHKLENPKLRAALEEFLKDEAFAKGKEFGIIRAASWEGSAEKDFEIYPPNDEHKNNYRVSFSLPKEITPEQFYQSILATETVKSHESHTKEEVVTKPVLGPMTEKVTQGAQQPGVNVEVNTPVMNVLANNTSDKPILGENTESILRKLNEEAKSVGNAKTA